MLLFSIYRLLTWLFSTHERADITTSSRNSSTAHIRDIETRKDEFSAIDGLPYRFDMGINEYNKPMCQTDEQFFFTLAHELSRKKLGNKNDRTVEIRNALVAINVSLENKGCVCPLCCVGKSPIALDCIHS